MFYERATKRVEKSNIGYSEIFQTENEYLELSKEILFGGYENIPATNQAKLVYILRGIGEGEVPKKENSKGVALEHGVSVQIPFGTGFKVNDSQLDYLLVRTKKNSNVELKGTETISVDQLKLEGNKVTLTTDNTPKLLYVLEGSGFGESEGKRAPLRDGGLVEIPPNTTLHMNGYIDYLLFSLKSE